MESVLQETWRMTLWRLPLLDSPLGPWKTQKAHWVHSCTGMHSTGPVPVSKCCSPAWPLESMGLHICSSRRCLWGNFAFLWLFALTCVSLPHFSPVSCPQRQPASSLWPKPSEHCNCLFSERNHLPRTAKSLLKNQALSLCTRLRVPEMARVSGAQELSGPCFLSGKRGLVHKRSLQSAGCGIAPSGFIYLRSDPF